MTYKKATVIAELGCVHAGKMDRAKMLIGLAAKCGADVVKFQKRNPKECVPKEWWDKPHPNLAFAYGETYLKHRINLELSQDQHADLKKCCEDNGVIYSTSVWDMTSAKEIIALNPSFIKIPSACNNNRELIDYIYENYKGEVHISLGMTSPSGRKSIYINFFFNNPLRTILYHCTSGYPVPFEKLYLMEIDKMRKICYAQEYIEHDGIDRRVGFSNHGYGIAADIAAYMLGATHIERHFVDDRMFPHSDSSASLEPQGLTKLCRDLENVYLSLKNKPMDIDEMEKEQMNKLRNH